MTKLTTPYFTLIERDKTEGSWRIAFGDYVRSVVQEEMRDMRDRARIEKTGTIFRIIRTDDSQRAIDAEVAIWNAEPSWNEAPTISGVQAIADRHVDEARSFLRRLKREG